ncbi:MAG TPA: hypothetical protein VFT44_20635 [Pyrinomonadaceae bacterium]|nr:hypothetical protein [Pyrinomonadaceae bacterium]
MCFSARYLPTVLLTILSLSASLCAQSTTKQPAKVPRGSVSGRVTIKENGAAGVVIGLRKGELYMSGEPYLKATTDHDGFYRFGNLTPGNYSLVLAASAFVMTRKDSQSKNVVVSEDESVEGINFALVRGGVITGRVTDGEGRPLIAQQVKVYTVEGFERRLKDQPVYPEREVQTDDRGIYRVFGLSAGRYKVAAGRTDDGYNFNFTERATYRQVFHPNTDEQAKATVIEVSEGSEASNVDIALGRALQTFSASGVAIDEKGMPVPNLPFEVQRRLGQRVEFVNAFAASNSRGEFVIEGLIPGKYGISVSQYQNRGEMRAEPLSFDITDQDIGGLTVRVSKGASLTGFVVLENEDKTLLSKLTEVQLRAFTMVQGGGGSFATSAIGPDGSFRLAGLSGGTINLTLGAMMSPVAKGFVIMRVEREGIVTPSSRLEIKDGEQLIGVRVVVSYGTATIRGIVKIENGSLPDGARLHIRMGKQGETFSGFRPTMPDERGHFLIEGVPAGTYELSVMIIGVPSSGPPRTVKQEVTVPDGGVRELTITIDMSAPVKP